VSHSYSEKYLPPHQRMAWPLRILRFLIGSVLMLLMAVASLNDVLGDQAYRICQERSECLSGCEGDVFPALVCSERTDISLTYGGNEYHRFFTYPMTNSNSFRTCKDYQFDNPGYESSVEDSDRQWRVHVCFRGCAMQRQVDPLMTADTRPECQMVIDEDGKKVNMHDLLCVYPEDECETINKPGEICTDSEKERCFSIGYIWLAILIANCMQWVFDVAFLFTLNVTFKPTPLEMLVKPPKEEKLQDEEEVPFNKVLNKCGGELIIFFITYIALHFTITGFIDIYTFGRPFTVWTEFVIAYGFDQAKSLMFQPLCWWLFVRRCGRAAGNFEEWDDVQVSIGVNDVSLLTELQDGMIAILESKQVTIFTIGLVIFYSIFILINLSVDPYLIYSQELTDGFYYVDLIILCIFILEILMRFFGYGFVYLCDTWNIVDATVVVISFVFSVVRMSFKGVGILRLLRLIRVIMVMRKVSQSKKKLQQLRKDNKGVESNVPRVLELLEELSTEKTITRGLKQDIPWLIDLVQSRKLYTITMGEVVDGEVGEYVKAWRTEIKKDDEEFLIMPTNAGKQQAKDKVMKRSRQSSVEMKMHGADMFNEKVNDSIKISGEELDRASNAMNNVDDWAWDVFAYSSEASAYAFPFLGMKLLLKYNIYATCNFNTDILAAFLSALSEGYDSKNPFHNAEHIMDTVQTCHYIYRTAGMETFLSLQDIAVGIIAAFVHDYEHPGVNNQFLIRTKHPKAIRYSDVSPLENHHVAAVFKLWMHTEYNIWDYLDATRWRMIRNMLIRMIVSSDMLQHFELYTNIQGKIQSDKFPQETMEDRLLLLTFVLHCADIGKFARPLSLYLKWSEKLMLEFFQQGETEKELKLPVSPFMDSENTIKERVLISYVEVIVQPTIELLNIISPPTHNDIIKRDMIENGVMVNKKNSQKKIEGDSK